MFLSTLDFDDILGMDWLSAHNVQIYCFAKIITFQLLGQRSIIVATHRENAFAESLVHIDCVNLEWVLLDVPLITELWDVFDEVPGLPLIRELEFCI